VLIARSSALNSNHLAINLLQNAIGDAPLCEDRTEAPTARIVYAMLMSLDGYIAGPDGDIALPVPEGELHRHFNDTMRQTSIALCGRRMCEVMRFWDSPDRETGASEVELDFAHAWRETPKIVFSTTLREVGPNA
jgi:dihydrofolate reductase